jgi:hypothetical protein
VDEGYSGLKNLVKKRSIWNRVLENEPMIFGSRKWQICEKSGRNAGKTKNKKPT